MFEIVVACDWQNGIAKDGKIPWNYPEDRKFFRSRIKGKIVIMGRKTFEQIGKPFPRSINFVISRTMEATEVKMDFGSVTVFNSILESLRFVDRPVVIAGGEEIYKWFVDQRLVDVEYITRISKDFQCDRFYHPMSKPDVTGSIHLWKDVSVNSFYHYTEEKHMLEVMREILGQDEEKNDRTGVGTKSVFGKFFQFDLSNDTFPLMTTRRLPLRQIFEELMFIIRGQTDTKILEKKKVFVWRANTTREELDKRGLFEYEEGEMGHAYGFSMRNFGAKYVPVAKRTGDEERGYDQLTVVMDKIKAGGDRRLLISMWEPNKIDEAALPPCLYGYQFNVRGDVLDCKMEQRSSDFALAGGWNVATGALFLKLMAHFCGKKPGKLFWSVGNVHLYLNHLEQARKQVDREPIAYPKLFFRDMPEKIEDVTAENLDLVGYVDRGFEKLRFEMNP
jgi:thymidylate synthase